MAGIKFAIIGGSGLGDLLSSEGTSPHSPHSTHDIDTPFGKPSAPILETTWGEGESSIPVFLLSRHGPGHLLNPSAVPYRANIFALKQLGVTHILATGAVGSLRDELKPRDLIIADQVIDKTNRRASTFFDSAAVHAEFAQPFDPVLRTLLLDAAKGLEGFRTHAAGTYVCMEGPAFSSRAESLMHRLWGGDVIGMTALPEARLAREAEIAYALIALATDFDAWKPKPADAPEAALLEEIIGHLKAASNNALALLRRALELAPSRTEQLQASPALSALKLAIWSDKSRIPQSEVDRLHPLWGRYFPENPQPPSNA